jgi:hypothetical protein
MPEKLVAPDDSYYYAMPEYNVFTNVHSLNQIDEENNFEVMGYDELYEAYEKYVTFRKGLTGLEFLTTGFEMSNNFETNMTSLLPTAELDYSAPSLTEYIRQNSFKNDNGYFVTDTQNGRPVVLWQVLPMINFNTQHGCVTNIFDFETKGVTYLKTKIYFEAYDKAQLFLVRPKFSSNINKQYTCSEALSYFEALGEVITENLQTYGFSTTPETIKRVLILDRVKIIGLVPGIQEPEREQEIDDYVYALANSDATLESCLYALSRVCNPDYFRSRKFALTVDEAVELNTVPQHFLYDVMG